SSRNPLLLFVIWFGPFMIVFLAARGTLSMYPLGPMNTQISTNRFVNLIPFNGAYSFNHAVILGLNHKHERDANIKALGYHGKINLAFADFFGIPLEQVPANPLDLMKNKTPANLWAEQTRPHVVLFVLEGWSAFWTQYSSAPFDLLGEFKKHSEEDLFFKKFLPGSGSTIGSLSNILIGSTQRATAPFLTESELLQVHFRTSPADVFKKAGYTTRFLYAGSTGWRDIGKFASYQGYDKVEGEIEIEKRFGKNPEMVHDWGIHDEAIFNYVKVALEEATTPQLFVVMTTTNHPPYLLPKSFTNLPPQVPADVEATLVGDRSLVHGRLRAFQYTNEKLGEFMTRLKKSPLAEKTIVAATGDHSFWIVNHSELQPLQKYAVPFYVYVPPAGRPKFADANRFGSHLAIFPSLYDLSLSNAEYFSFGKSLFAEKGPFYAYHSSDFVLSSLGGTTVFVEGPTFTKWNSDFTELEPLPAGAPELPELAPLATSYKALMSVLDFYYEIERKGEE
ncbi:MAG: LTA synthase family protein, partial [Pseudobdellovibrionaceae bacterium]